MADLRKLARGKACNLRFPTVCESNNETVVLCHLKIGWHGSSKPPDICGVYGCMSCHSVLDGRNTHTGWTKDQIHAMAFRGYLEQIRDYLDTGIIKVCP